MIKFFIFLFFLLLSKNIFSTTLGETEISADDGIEVFQKEKYYFLKNNVVINSENLNLKANIVKAYFDKDLYDIIRLYAEGNVTLNAKKRNLNAKGDILEFFLDSEKIYISGKNSELILNQVSMNSDGLVEVNNLKGTFLLNGKNSELKNEDILVKGEKIEGEFKSINNVNEITKLDVQDNEISNIKTDKIDMYSLKALYDKKNDIIELMEKVKVIRDNEIITGDYGFVDIKNNSYKVTSNDSKKVKVLISKNDE